MMSAALDERIAGFGVHDQVEIALAIAGIGVGKSVELFRQRMQALAQKRDFLRVHGRFAGLGLEYKALYADHVADVVGFERLVRFLAHGVAGRVDLNLPVKIEHVREGRLAHDALRHESSGDADVLVLRSSSNFALISPLRWETSYFVIWKGSLPSA